MPETAPSKISHDRNSSAPAALGALSPDDIELTTFHITAEGYDKDEVEVFLRAVASDVRALKRELESTQAGSHRPLEALGQEMGALMQHAHDAAGQVRKSAETEAATVLQKAQHDASKARQEAEKLKKRYESETLVARDEAMAVVDRLREQAEQQRRLADAQVSILHQEARRSAKQIQDKAKKKAQDLLARVDAEAEARTSESERRLRKLQEVETKLRRRIDLLSSKLQAMTDHVRQAISEGETQEPDDEEPIRQSAAPSIRITDAGTVRIDQDETVS